MERLTFLRMTSHMLLQGSRFRKVLFADLALKRAMSRMGLKMTQDLLLARESLLPVSVATRPVAVIMATPAPDVRRRNVGRQRVTGRERAAARLPMANMRGRRAIVMVPVLVLACRRLRRLRR